MGLVFKRTVRVEFQFHHHLSHHRKAKYRISKEKTEYLL